MFICLYEEIGAYNLGSQVPNEELVAKAIELKADAILVSQVARQKDVHIPAHFHAEYKGVKALVDVEEPKELFNLKKQTVYEA